MLHWIQRWFGKTPPTNRMMVAARSEDPAIRQGAATVLADLDESWVTEELLRLVADTNPAVREAARQSLERHKSVNVPVLLAGIKDPQVEIGVACAELVGKAAMTQVVKALLGALKFEKRPVQLAARKALGRCGAVAVPFLKEALTEQHPWVREQIATALAEAEKTAAEVTPS